MRKFIVYTITQFSQGDTSRRLKPARFLFRMEDGTSAINILKGKPTEKINLGRPRRRWKKNVRKCLLFILLSLVYKYIYGYESVINISLFDMTGFYLFVFVFNIWNLE
jgi:hypothetical protein